MVDPQEQLEPFQSQVCPVPQLGLVLDTGPQLQLEVFQL